MTKVRKVSEAGPVSIMKKEERFVHDFGGKYEGNGTLGKT
jgi:hypothetical protein